MTRARTPLHAALDEAFNATCRDSETREGGRLIDSHTMHPRSPIGDIARVAHYLESDSGYTRRDAARALVRIARRLNDEAGKDHNAWDAEQMAQLLGAARHL